uniref:C-type lectin domain-containing protein n=1 Tax=Cyprinus carpio TaxID=7962 RepID=A0A8C1YUM5_CYPCA
PESQGNRLKASHLKSSSEAMGAEMNLMLFAAVSGVTDPSVWIGLKRDWVWSLSNSSFYGEGEAEYRRNENCGALDIAGEFWDVPCTNQYPFICYDGKDTYH